MSGRHKGQRPYPRAEHHTQSHDTSEQGEKEVRELRPNHSNRKGKHPSGQYVDRPTSPMQAGPSNFGDNTQSSAGAERLQRRNDTVPSKKTAQGHHTLESKHQMPSIRNAISQADRVFEALEVYLRIQQLDKIAALYQQLDRSCIPQSSDTSENAAYLETWNSLHNVYIDKIITLATKLEQYQDVSEWLKRSSGFPDRPKLKGLSRWIGFNGNRRGLDLSNLLEFLSSDGTEATRRHFNMVIEELRNWLNEVQMLILNIMDKESVRLHEATVAVLQSI